MTAALENAKLLAGMQGQKTVRKRGICTAINLETGLATFNINGGVQSMPMIGWPSIGWDAWILYIADQPICLGPVARSPWAIVTAAPEAGRVEVTGDDGLVSLLPYADSLTLALADRVVIDWTAGVVIAEPAAETVPDVPVPPIGGSGEMKTWTFFPRESGSFGSSWFTDRVYCGDSNIGAFFYDGIADTIPDEALIQPNGVRIHIDSIANRYDNAASIGLHSSSTKAGPPVITSAFSFPGDTGDWILPESFGDALKTGAALGLGTPRPGGGDHIWSPANVNNSGALTITAQLP